MTEMATSDVSHLVVSVGAGIRFGLTSPKTASFTHVLAETDIPRFQQALGRVKDYLAAH
jgi:hypothetical protein